MKYWITNGCFHVDFEHLCKVRPLKWYVDEWKKQPEDLYSEGTLIELPDDTETLIIPEGVERLVNGSFDSIPGLKRLVLPRTLKKIEPFSINDMNITSIEFPEGLKSIGGVSNCDLLEEVYVPDGTEEIMSHGFAWNNGLKTVRLPASLRKIGSMAFERCFNLQTINLPEGLVSFGNDAFSRCKSLKTLVIPSSFRSSGGKDHYSFPDGLEEVTFYSCFKGFEAELGWVKRFYIPAKIYKTVRRAYPDKEIYDLEGNLLEDDSSSFVQSSTDASIPGDYQFPKFSNFEKDIPADGINWHITSKGAASANRAWKTAQEVAGGSEDERLYDSALLAQYNNPLYEDYDRPTLKDTSCCERQYCEKLEPQQILNRAYDFVSALEKGLQEENLPSLIDLLPHKKNGTLCIGRKNVLLTCSFCDHQGMSYSFFAKSVSDTEVELTVKKVYIGDFEYTKDDLVNTYRAILPAGNPTVQSGKAAETTKGSKSNEKKPAEKKPAAKKTKAKPDEPKKKVSDRPEKTAVKPETTVVPDKSSGKPKKEAVSVPEKQLDAPKKAAAVVPEKQPETPKKRTAAASDKTTGSPKKSPNKPAAKTKSDAGKGTVKASEPAKKKPAAKMKTDSAAPASSVNAADKATTVPETDAKPTQEKPQPDEAPGPVKLIVPEGITEISKSAYTEKNRRVEEEMAREEKKKTESAAKYSAAGTETPKQPDHINGYNTWETQARKRYTADMIPPETENPEDMAERLNRMDPGSAEKMMQLLLASHKTNEMMNQLRGTGRSRAKQASAAEPGQRQRIWRRIYELEEKRDNLKGLFADFRKKRIQNEIDRLKDELKQMKKS